MDLIKTGRQFGQASTPSLFTSLVNEHYYYPIFMVKKCLDINLKSQCYYSNWALTLIIKRKNA